jgi:SAM-dependent methyltransferase
MRSNSNRGFDPFLFAAGETATTESLREYVRHFYGCQTVVDLATGRGYFLDLLRDAGIDCFGVDHDPTLVEDGLARGLKMVEADALSYLRDSCETFDGIMASHIIEHFAPEDGLEFLRLTAERLAPGGILVIVTPNVRNQDVFRTVFHLDLDHKTPWPLELLESMVQRLGLTSELGGSSRIPLLWYKRNWRANPKLQTKNLAKRFLLDGFGFSFLLGDTFIVAQKPTT